MAERKRGSSGPTSRGKRRRNEEKSSAGDATKEVEEQDENNWERESIGTMSTVRVEEDFPRGGDDVITPLERRTLRHQAQQDVLFGKTTLKPSEMSSLDMKGGVGKLKESVDKDDVEIDFSRKGEAKITYLNPKSLTEGMLLLGAVREIHQHNIIFSLPFNMFGSVSINNISDTLSSAIRKEVLKDEDDSREGNDENMEVAGEKDEDRAIEIAETQEDIEVFSGSLLDLTRLLHVGQILPCYIISVNSEKRQVELSLNPRLINSLVMKDNILPNMVLSGCVSSIEDHGYVIDFGINDKHGFLIKKNATDFIKQYCTSKSLNIGQVITCAVLSTSDTRVVSVTINPQIVYSSLLSVTFFPLSALLPGLLVNVKVKHSVPSGLKVTFLGGFEGSISVKHLSGKDFSPERFAVGNKLKARILWVDIPNKMAGLTLQRHVVTGSEYRFSGMEIGDTFHEAKIISSHSRNGVILDLGNGAFGFAPLRLLCDEKINEVQKVHSIGSCHSCRIIQFNLIDGFAIVSLQQSILDKPFMKLSDIKPGQVVDGEIKKLTEKGVYIRLTDHFDGFCPNTELADYHVKRARKKLTEGLPVKCRVLVVDLENRFILLTRKKTLINSELTPLTSYSDVKAGDVYDGVVSAIFKNGLLIKFYNNVKGFIPKMELSSSSTQIIMDPASAFKTGQVVRCIVLRYIPENNRLSLSLKLDKPVSATPDKELTTGCVLKAGEIVDLQVTGVTSSGITLHHNDSQELVYMPLEYLSDHAHLCSDLLAYHSSLLEQATSSGLNYVINEVLIMSERLPSCPTMATTKKLLIAAVRNGSYPSEYSELKVGMLIPGVIKKSFTYGCFVDFPNSMVGLAPVRYLKDEFISDSSGIFSDKSTVIAKVQEFDEEKKRFLVSLRCSDLRLALYYSLDTTTEILLNRLQWLLEERDFVLSTVINGVDNERKYALRSFDPGAVIYCKIESIKDQVIQLTLENDCLAEAAVATATGIDVAVGNQLLCCVLDVDISNGKYAVSLNPNLTQEEQEDELEKRKNEVKKRKRNIRKKIDKYESKTMLQPGRAVTVIIEHVTPFYVVCTCSSLIGSTLAYGVFDSGQWGEIPHQLKLLRPGQKFDAVVASSSSLLLGTKKGLPVVLITEGRKVSRQKPSQTKLSVGDIVDAKVLNVLATQMNVSCGAWKGRVHITMATDELVKDENPLKLYTAGDVVKARILEFRKYSSSESSVKPRTATLELTTKPSLLDDDVLLSEEKILCLLSKTFSVGDSVLGVVKEISGLGIVLTLAPCVTAIVPPLLATDDVKRLASDAIERKQIAKELKLLYKPGDIVESTIIDNEQRKHDYTASLIGPDVTVVGQICKVLSEGEVVTGTVKAVSDVGVFVRLGCGIVGRVMIANLSDRYIKNFKSVVEEGEIVRVKVIEVNKSTGKVELSLKLSDIDPTKKHEVEQNKGTKRRRRVKRKIISYDSDDDTSSDSEQSLSSSEEDPSEDEKELKDEIPRKRKRDVKELPVLHVSGGFDWGDSEYQTQSVKEDDTDTEEDEQPTSKKTRRQKKAVKVAEETFLYNKEQELLDSSKIPESADDFDRMIATNPNSSSLWLQYMAFYLHTAEVDKARSVARKALTTISFREEQEKLNVWVGLMNLENMYGTQDSLVSTFQQALQQNEQLPVYYILTNIYQLSDKLDLAEQLYQTMTKKFSNEQQVWIRYGVFQMQQGRLEAARNLLKRSLKSLSKQQHVAIISKFAQFEFKYGDIERGRTMFESLLSSYPRRVDLWCVYLDMMIQTNDITTVREIFERAISLKVSVKKMKFLFKRYLKFEELHGSSDTVDSVREKAKHYVSKNTISSNESTVEVFL